MYESAKKEMRPFRARSLPRLVQGFSRASLETREGIVPSFFSRETKQGQEKERKCMQGVARQGLLAVVALGMSLAAFAVDPLISVSIRQRYPWNGLVDINFTITGDAGTKYDTSFTAKDMVGNTNIAMRTIRKADGTAAAAKEQLLPGTYSWVWDAVADFMQTK